MLNAKPGKGIISLEAPAASPMAQKFSNEIQTVLQHADNSIDHRGVKKSRAKKEVAVQRTYQISLANVERMEKIRDTHGSDFSWQINRALEYWFEKVHP